MGCSASKVDAHDADEVDAISREGAGSGVAGGVTNAGSAAKRGSVKE